MFFWMYMLIQFLSLFLDSGVIPTANVSYPWFAAVYSGLVSAIYCCLLINGFVGFQFAEDGTPVSLWLLRLSTLAVFGLSFFISIATFKSFASFSPSKPTALFVIYLIWPIICVVTYTLSQLILVFRTLDDRWPLGDVLFGIGFYTVAQVLLFAFSVTICNAIQHYLDGLFFFELCVLLSVMMVYKYWDSITREDLEFSVGSKAAVWEIKDPLLAGSYEDSSDAGYGANTGSLYHGGGGYGNGSQYGGNAQSMYGGPSPSLVGGLSGTQMYGGAGTGKGGHGGRGYPPNTAERY